MQKLIYVPPGADFEDAQKRVILTAEEPFILSTVTGLGGVEADVISSEVVGMDGEYYHGCKRSPRPIKCKVWVRGKNREDMYAQRMSLIGSLTPGKGTLYYTNDHISVSIAAVPKLPPDFVQRIKNYNSADIEFYCPQPSWKSLEEQQAEIAYIADSGFRFPTELNQTRFRQMKNDITINYKGTDNAPVTITVAGPSATPVITNRTTGKSIVMTRALQAGELLTICTERGNKSVTLTSGGTETDAFGYLSPISKFWELVPGVNRIRYGNGGVAQTSVTIRYSERYAGV